MIHSHKIQLGGRARSLSWRFKELRLIEEKTGFSFQTGEAGFVRPDSLSFALVLMWAGLQRDGVPTMEEVEDLLDEEPDLDLVFASVGEAWRASRPEKDNAEDPPPAQGDSPPPGMTSGPKDATTSD